MNKVLLLALLFTGSILSACAQNIELIRSANVTTRTDVYRELPERAPIPPGYADLYVFVSLKTHKPGIYPPEKKPHGTADYMLLLNIDGQATRMRGTLKKEDIEPRFPRDPEAGEGIRYNFRKDIRLKASTHGIAVAIPDDEVIVVKEVILLEGTANFLFLEPVYGTRAGKKRPGFYRLTRFTQGITGLKAYLNGRPL